MKDNEKRKLLNNLINNYQRMKKSNESVVYSGEEVSNLEYLLAAGFIGEKAFLKYYKDGDLIWEQKLNFPITERGIDYISKNWYLRLREKLGFMIAFDIMTFFATVMGIIVALIKLGIIK